MRKFYTLVLVSLFYCIGVQAQKITDKQIGFDPEIIRKDLQAHNVLGEEEMNASLAEIRLQYVEYYMKLQAFSKSNQTKAAVPTPITSSANMDFSQNTNLWTLNASRSNYATRPSQDFTTNSWGVQGNFFTPTINDPVTGFSRFQVLPASSFDPRLNSAINPNAALGANVLRLGNPNEFPSSPNINSFQGQEEISKRFVLTNQNSVLKYSYAIIFEDIGHVAVPNSFDIFIAVNGVPLTGCSEINFSYNDALAGNGFIPSALNPTDLVRPWTTNTIDLLSLPNVQLGDVISISFRNRDCGYTVHGSYAYVSAECLPSSEAIVATSASGDICVNEAITFTTDVDILVGATTQWQILQGSNVIATIPNGSSVISYTFNQAGTYTVNFTMTSLDGCTINSSTTIVVTECCLDCVDTGTNIINSITPVLKECGTYKATITQEMLDCYTVQIFKGDGTPWTTVTSSNLINNTYYFNYANNGTYTAAVRLIDPTTGKVCFIKKYGITVKCCPSCDKVGEVIFNSLTDTENCGEYAIKIPDGVLDCYKLQVYLDTNGWNTVDPIDVVNNTYVFSYANEGNNTYAIRLIDPITGKICYYNKKGIYFECDTEVCQNDPALEQLLATNLKDILNAILDLNNGFTGNCISGSASTIVDITNMPEVVQFMQVYDLQDRLQHAIDVREAEFNGNYPYYTANITHVYYKWGYGTNGRPPCLRLTFANQAYGQLGPTFSYWFGGGYANGAPLSVEGLNPNLIEEFTNISINVDEFKATYEYLGTDGQTHNLYDILWPYTIVEGSGNALRFCSFHDLDFIPPSVDSINNVEEMKEIDDNDLVLFPNPTSSEFTINFKNTSKIDGYELTIRSVTGLMVHQSKNQARVSVQQLPVGVYFVNVTTEDGKLYRKQLIVN